MKTSCCKNAELFINGRKLANVTDFKINYVALIDDKIQSITPEEINDIKSKSFKLNGTLDIVENSFENIKKFISDFENFKNIPSRKNKNV